MTAGESGVAAGRPHVLFSAPAAFMPDNVFGDWPFEVVRREIWHEDQLQSDAHAIGWITNTGWSLQLAARLALGLMARELSSLA